MFKYKALQSAFDKAREKQRRPGVEHPHSNQTHHHENNARSYRIFTSNVVLLFNFFKFFCCCVFSCIFHNFIFCQRFTVENEGDIPFVTKFGRLAAFLSYFFIFSLGEIFPDT